MIGDENWVSLQKQLADEGMRCFYDYQNEDGIKHPIRKSFALRFYMIFNALNTIMVEMKKLSRKK